MKQGKETQDGVQQIKFARVSLWIISGLPIVVPPVFYHKPFPGFLVILELQFRTSNTYP